MTLGDSLVHAAFTTGNGFTRSMTTAGTVRITVQTPDGTQHFLRPDTGSAADWRAADLENPRGGFRFDEPVSEEWGLGLEALAG
ncbi:hypothetical protein OG897_26985 [Streptomyces sp. NBC_00237]|uniref:hypothetical protein n=1 Tax=Streptomyces sp. NBC_00237 TaxID=2975687 RepID=UPI00225B4F5B|nr:hypothetical protein [Streptomyces sp. NBC_00237]MCX5205088.1 hypothetical protein [Streptomyces sp. NBC_00237]